jgi:hypothetical protein
MIRSGIKRPISRYNAICYNAICLSRRRCTEEGMRIASRYFATVRRAMVEGWRRIFRPGLEGSQPRCHRIGART